MNAQRLLEHFDRLAEAPDAIPRLRRFILDLAVRGKLVEQDPNDEPAAELLKRIAKTNIDQTDLPVGWRRSTVGTILNLQYGKGLKASERNDKGSVPVFGSNGIVGFTEEALTAEPSIIIGRKGSAGALQLCDGPSWTTDVAYFVESPAFFVLRYLLVALATLNLDRLGKGVKPGLSRSDAYAQIISIPPLAEQYRIVAKVDELMALCNQLEAAQAEREQGRERLLSASLQRLNQPAEEAETFQQHARFVLDHLPRLTVRPEQIKSLRQTILNLAVCGRLVPQDANDESASALLKKIAKEKADLVKNRTIKPEKPRKENDFSFSLFGLPSNWAWANTQAICISITDGDHLPPPKAEFGIPFLVIGDVRSKRINYSSERSVTAEYYQSLDLQRKPKKGDLLYTLVGSFGIPIEVREDQEFCVQRHIGILRPSAHIAVSFLAKAMESEFVYYQASTCATGIAQKTIPLSCLRKLLIPLPPLAEQHRIVAKLDELMAICDQLEAHLTTTHTDNRRLLEAVLHDALAPALADAA
jgi:type I restriction enzyme, S subunit